MLSGPVSAPCNVRWPEEQIHDAEQGMRILVSDVLEQSLIEVLTREGFEVDNRPGIQVGEFMKIIPSYHGLVVRSSPR